MKRVLICDDDVAVTNYLMVFLMQTERFETEVVNDSRMVERLLEEQQFDLLLLDMDMPNVSGMDILKIVQKKAIPIKVIILTGVSDVELAVKSLKRGAFDYLSKPVDEEKLLEVMDAALEHSEIHHSIEQLPPQLKREDLTHEAAFERFPTQDAEMIRVLHQAERMAGSDLDLLIWGERGVGKENFARAIHQASPRHADPFVAVEVSAQDPERFPADFFGQARVWSGEHEERPGFVEEAGNGTIYLGQVERLSPPMQVRVKRLLQTNEFYRENSTRTRTSQVRFIISSTFDLGSDRFRGQLLDDLRFHLLVNSIYLPPLRERKGDIRLLAEFYLQMAVQKVGKEVTGFSDEYFDFLLQYHFPDNLQQLRNLIQGSVVNCEDTVVTIDSIPPYIRQKISTGPPKEAEAFQPCSLDQVIREYARRTVDHFEADMAKAAVTLGVDLDRLEEILRGE